MNILQFNVRLAEGGAAGVALDLHQRALQQGWRHILSTVTAKAAKRASAIRTIRRSSNIRRGWMTAMANIALFRLFNRDLFGNFNELYRTITRTPGPVVLHFHVLHSYWLNLKSVVRFCEKVKTTNRMSLWSGRCTTTGALPDAAPLPTVAKAGKRAARNARP